MQGAVAHEGDKIAQGKLAQIPLHTETVSLGEADQNIRIRLRQVVDDAVNIGLGVLGTVDGLAVRRHDIEGIGDAEVVPEDPVQGGVFVDPLDL